MTRRTDRRKIDSGSTDKRQADKGQAESLATLAGELWDLLVTYTKQQTIDPIKTLGRYLGLGTIGMLLMGTGFVLLVVAGLRALQNETGQMFTGKLTWVPYAIVASASLLVIAGTAGVIARGSSRRRP